MTCRKIPAVSPQLGIRKWKILKTGDFLQSRMFRPLLRHFKFLTMQKRINLLIVLSGVFQLLYGQPDSIRPKEHPFTFGASYIGDAYGNAVGGLKRGVGFMGMGNLTIGFDTEKAHGWKGGSFFVNGATIHGKSLSENFSGDLQIASNIDAGTHIYMHELWFKQDINKFSFTIGLQDLNAGFMVTENGAEFINSSFGIPPVLSGNLPVPIFPLTGLGVSAKWSINQTYIWQTAVFDGCQKPFEHNPHNLHWSFGKNDGLFAVTEFHTKLNPEGKEGCYKLGAYYHSGLNEFDKETQSVATVFKHNYGFYLIADQTVFEQKNRKLDLFMQVAVTPKCEEENKPNHYIGLGANLFGVFDKKKNDALGFAVAHTGLKANSYRHETTLELYYKYQFNENFGIQPDIQYIICPAGTGIKLPDALVGMIRFHVNF